VENAYSPFAKYGYLYDGDGDRIAKGTLTSFSCNLASNGFALTNSYVVDKDGGQLTEFQGSTAVHTNVFGGGALLAMYANSNTYFTFADWLGTKRAEASPDGCHETYTSLAYGDELIPSGTCLDATEHHYTGKEHDGESGNDFFLARYYSSTAGRFLSPDWASGAEAVPYAQFDDPQSLNLYGYTQNSPLTSIDPDGHCSYGYEEMNCSQDDDSASFQENEIEGAQQQAQQKPIPVKPITVTVHGDDGGCDPSSNDACGFLLSNSFNRLRFSNQAIVGAYVLFSKAIQHDNPNPAKGARPIKDKNNKVIKWSIPTKGGDKGRRIVKGLDWGSQNGLDPNDPKWQMVSGAAAAGVGALTATQILEGIAAGAALF
jgi:RHS repeat-associated protein